MKITYNLYRKQKGRWEYIQTADMPYDDKTWSEIHRLEGGVLRNNGRRLIKFLPDGLHKKEYLISEGEKI